MQNRESELPPAEAVGSAEPASEKSPTDFPETEAKPQKRRLFAFLDDADDEDGFDLEDGADAVLHPGIVTVLFDASAENPGTETPANAEHDLDTSQFVGSELVEQIYRFEAAATEKSSTLARSVSGAGSVLGSLAGLLTACGPFCAHALGSMTQAASSIGPGGLLGGATNSFGGIPGFSLDNNGNYSFSGSLGDLSSTTGLSGPELLSGKYSAHDILGLLVHVIGDGIFSCAHGFFSMMLETFIPSPGFSSQAA